MGFTGKKGVFICSPLAVRKVETQKYLQTGAHLSSQKNLSKFPEMALLITHLSF